MYNNYACLELDEVKQKTAGLFIALSKACIGRGGLWLSGFDAARAFGQATCHQCWRVRVQFPSGTLDFLLEYVIPISGQAAWGFLRVLRFVPPPSGTFKIKIRFPNSVIAELALRATWL